MDSLVRRQTLKDQLDVLVLSPLVLPLLRDVLSISDELARERIDVHRFAVLFGDLFARRIHLTFTGRDNRVEAPANGLLIQLALLAFATQVILR